MKKLIIIILISSISFISCSESLEKTSDTPYKLSIKNEKAYELYKSARLKSQRGDYVGSKLDFEACLRIDPNFIMACLDINETNIVKKNNYTKRAYKNYNNASETEKIFIDLSRVKNDEEKLLLLNRLALLNPDNSDVFYRLGSYYLNKDYNKFKENFEKALSINPNNWDVNRTLFFRKYPGFGSGNPLVKTTDNFFIYPDSINSLESDIKKLIKIDTLNVQVYRKFGDIWRNSNDLEKAKDYYIKGAELCSVDGNSFRSELIHTAGNATFLMGNIDESFKFFNESLEIEFDLYPRMKRVYQLATAYLFDQNHEKAIETLDNYEESLPSSGLTDFEITQVLVSIYNYKAFFYADMGDKINSLKSFSKFKEYAKDVYDELPDFNISFIQSRNSNLGLNSGLNDRLDRITPSNMIYDETWLNLLNRNLKTSKKLIDGDNFDGNTLKSFKLLYNYFSGNHKEVIKIGSELKMVQMNSEGTPVGGNTNNVLSRFQLAYCNYYVAKSLIKLKKFDEAKILLKSVTDGRAFGWRFGLIRKEAKALLSSL